MTKRGEVSLGGNHYAVPDDLVGLRVTVAFHPFDLREVYTELQGQTIIAQPALPVAHLALPKLTEPARRRRGAGRLPPGLARAARDPAPGAVRLRSLRRIPRRPAAAGTGPRTARRITGPCAPHALPARPAATRGGRASDPSLDPPCGRDLHLSRYLAAMTKDGDI